MQLAKLPRPCDSDLRFLRGWLGGEKEGDAFLKGSEFFTWDIPNGSPQERGQLDRDLITLHVPPEEQDSFSQHITTKLLDLYHSLWGSRSTVSRGHAVRRLTHFLT